MRRKTREQKLLEGVSYRPHRDRKTPQFAVADVRCPRYLTGEARKEWQRIVPLLQQAGILREIDRSLLSSYCQMFAHWRASEDDLKENGLVLMISSQTRTGRTDRPAANPAAKNSVMFFKAMSSMATKFGISPLDRPRIEVPPTDEQDDELWQFINDQDANDIPQQPS